jgi:hypothetical protein
MPVALTDEEAAEAAGRQRAGRQDPGRPATRGGQALRRSWGPEKVFKAALQEWPEIQVYCKACKIAGIAQLVERNLAKVEVESSRLFSRSKFHKGKPRLPFFVKRQRLPPSRKQASLFYPAPFWRDSKAVMQRIANPSSPVRLRIAPPVSDSLDGTTRPALAVGLRQCLSGPGGETGRHCGLKIRRFPAKGRAGSIPARGTRFAEEPP